MSPSTARAGHQRRLPTSGAMATRGSEASTARRDSVPCDTMAASCRPTTKPAPITAATICATRRVRLGPMVRNSAVVSSAAIATAAVAAAATIA